MDRAIALRMFDNSLSCIFGKVRSLYRHKWTFLFSITNKDAAFVKKKRYISNKERKPTNLQPI